MSLAELTLVTQEDEKGCGLACIAMLTGYSYQDVKKLYQTMFKKDINAEGMYPYEKLALLSRLGFASSIIEYSATCCLPLGRTFLISVPSLNMLKGMHLIIVQTFPDEIKVYDPSNKENKYTEMPKCWFDVVEIIHEED